MVALNIILITVITGQDSPKYNGIDRISISVIGPLQQTTGNFLQSVRNIWKHYFYLVYVSKENDNLKKEISLLNEKTNYCRELEISNLRLQEFFDFRKTRRDKLVAAEIIGKSPTPWRKTVVINKGKDHGVEKGMPVVIPDGVVGQISEVSDRYSRVILILDRLSSVDGIVQESRARGIVQGKSSDTCMFNYALRKHDFSIGDVIITSGIDGVYPKGLRIGAINKNMKFSSGIFQEVEITPFVDFEKLEEVLVVLKPDRGHEKNK